MIKSVNHAKDRIVKKKIIILCILFSVLLVL